MPAWEERRVKGMQRATIAEERRNERVSEGGWAYREGGSQEGSKAKKRKREEREREGSRHRPSEKKKFMLIFCWIAYCILGELTRHPF